MGGILLKTPSEKDRTVQYFKYIINRLVFLLAFYLPLSAVAQSINLPIAHDQKAVKLSLPSTVTVQDDFSKGYLYPGAWRYGADAFGHSLGKGRAAIQITFPKQVATTCDIGDIGACYTQSFIRIGISNAKKAYATCLLPQPLPNTLGISIAKNAQSEAQSIQYTAQDAAMMHDLDIKGMAFKIQHHCYVIELFDTSVGDSSQNPQAIRAYQQLIHKFRLLNSTKRSLKIKPH